LSDFDLVRGEAQLPGQTIGDSRGCGDFRSGCDGLRFGRFWFRCISSWRRRAFGWRRWLRGRGRLLNGLLWLRWRLRVGGFRRRGASKKQAKQGARNRELNDWGFGRWHRAYHRYFFVRIWSSDLRRISHPFSTAAKSLCEQLRGNGKNDPGSFSF
jgi:hypothetical protein